MSALGRVLGGRRIRFGSRRLAIPDPRAHPRAALALAAGVLVLGIGFLWLRSSPLVAVQRVTVSGLSGADAPAIRAALVARAHSMTTLDYSESSLKSAVSAYPEVKGVTASASFPHGLSIVVHEEIPVGMVNLGGQVVPIASDGTIMRPGAASGAAAGALPTVALSSPATGTRLTDPVGMAEVDVLAAAPYQLLPRLAAIRSAAGRGIIVQTRQGPLLVFGTATELGAKWRAVAAVLASPTSAGASYLDVTDPGRPAAGVPASAVPSSSAGSGAGSGSAATGAAGSSTTGSSGPAATGSTGASAAGNSGAAATGGSGASSGG